ncbi:M48 family metalloprotease [Streptosporangium subroseum]|uniref:M48 family metalloprotease n=1 Tax=Streptosporangium subroseum TaxID=106412 RepID=UPI0030914BCF|nr:M48 family metalloprotease [Streptosporangium subroseum]
MRTSAAEPGGFGGGGPGELPIILDALRVVSGDLLGLLSGHPLGNLLVLLAMRQATQPAQRVPRPGASPPVDAAPALDQAIDGLRSRLRAQGIAPGRAEELTYDALKLVFQQDRDPVEIEAFLRALAGSPPSAPPAGGEGGLPATGGETSGWMLPPWLWLYFLGILAPSVPQAVERFQDNADGMAALVGQLAVNVRRAGTAVLTATGILEFLPALLLLAGIAGVLFPGARGRWAERRHRLLPSDEPVIGEMAAFARRHAPAAELRLGERHDRLARVYPVGWREARVAVYPPLVRLWTEDRQAAQAVLLHEVAHLRQGDHLIVGLASPFVWFVKSSGVALAVLALVPSTIYLIAGGAGASPVLGSVLYAMVAIPIGLILPVAGLWVSELSADRYAMTVAGAAALARALGPARPHGGAIRRVLGLLSHPPRRLRLWAVRAWPGGTIALAALWPLACVVRLAAVAIFELVERMLNGSPFPEALETVAGGFPEELSSVSTLLAEMTVLLVNWPLLAPLWLRIWTPFRAVRHRFAPYLMSALLPGLLIAGGLTAGTADETALAPNGPTPTLEAAPERTGSTATPEVIPERTGLGSTPEATPERTGLVDDRPWTGQDLPVNLRILAPYSTLEQHGGDPAWKDVAAGWLGAGVWNAGKDGLFAFTALADRPDLRPGVGGWLRIGDEVTFSLPIEQDAEGRTVATEINGTIDLGRSPAVMNAFWARKPDGSPTDLLPALALEFTAALDVSTAP